MKISFLVLVLLLTSISGQAQKRTRTFKPFKVDLALGRAFHLGAQTHNGGIFAMEPKYALSDKLAVGYRMELANLGPRTGPDIGFFPQLHLTLTGQLTADYFFTLAEVRPFMGLGLGGVSVPGEDDPTTPTTETYDTFGFTPRAGLETGHFRAALEMNWIGKAPRGNFNYLGVKAGFFLGGKRIDKQKPKG